MSSSTLNINTFGKSLSTESIHIHVKIDELSAELTLVSVFAGDVEAALDPQGTDSDEGVSSGRSEAVVLLAGVVVPSSIVLTWTQLPGYWDTYLFMPGSTP